MTWTVSRNDSIDEAAILDRSKQTICLLKDRLKAATVPWTVVGSGSGTGGSSNMAGTDLLPTFPSITGIADFSWICLQNTDGLQIVLQIDGASLYFYWCRDGGYESAGDESEILRPGNTSPPTKEVDMNGAGTANINVSLTAAHYKSVAVEDSGQGFILFGKFSSSAAFHTSLLVTSGDPLDVDEYVATHFCTNSNSPWTMDVLEGTGTPQNRQMYHPTAGQSNMVYCDLQAASADVFDTNLQVNPYSNKTQLLGIVVVCPTNPNKFVKGSMPGLYRVPESKSTGDKFESGELMNMYDIAVPWGSNTVELL